MNDALAGRCIWWPRDGRQSRGPQRFRGTRPCGTMGGVDGGRKAAAMRRTMRLVMVRTLTRRLALHARGPGQRRGGGAVLASLGSRWGPAADALACAVRSRPSAKMGGGVSGAPFAWLTLFSWHRGRAADSSAHAARSRPSVKGRGGSGALCARPTLLVAQGEVGGGGSCACCAHDARHALVGVGRVLGVVR